MAAEILIVDDEADIRDLVAGILQDEGYATRTARNSDDALAAIATRRPNLVFLDIWLQGSKLDGLQLLDSVKQEHTELPVVMISGHGNIETAVAAIKHGAYDFIEKPFKADRLVLVADRALENSRLKREVKQLKQLSPQPSTLVGRSAMVGQLRQAIERVAPTNSRVLVVGTVRSGQGARGTNAPSAIRSGKRALCRHQRRSDHAGTHGNRTFRCRPVQRLGRAQARCARRGAWRHVVHRRYR